MEFLLPWLLLASVQLAATISPGPAFTMTVKNAIAHNRNAGIFTAIGLGIGVGIHIIFVFTGASLILNKYPIIFYIIKYIGAAYLIWIGIKGIRAKASKQDVVKQNAKAKNPNRTYTSFLTQGILTNITNPKAWVFFPAVFTQFITPGMPIEVMILYGSTVMAIEAGWFTILSIFLTTKTIRTRFLSISHWIERVCGGLLIALGVKLILDKGLKAAG